MKKIQTSIVALTFMALGAFVFLPISTVGAVGPLDGVCGDPANADSAVCVDKNASSDTFIKSLVNTLLYILGAVSVLAIIIGGILYVTSSGNSSNVTRAKNTIIYAIVGLVVSFLAYAIVNWVFDLF